MLEIHIQITWYTAVVLYWQLYKKGNYILYKDIIASGFSEYEAYKAVVKAGKTEFKQYRRKQIAELRPFTEGEILSEMVSISQADKDAGSPKEGDMIARNPKNYKDQWLVAKQYFKDNFEPLS